MSSPYRHHEKRGPELLELTLRPEVWGSVIATLVVTFTAGLSLCATAEETLGLATGTLLLLATLAMAPLGVVAARRRPSHLEVEADHLIVTYPSGSKQRIDRADLFIHQVDRGRIALDRAGKVVIYIDELMPLTKRAVLHRLTDLAGYDVTTPAFAARRLSHKRIDPDLRFETRLSFAPLLGILAGVLGLAAAVVMALSAPLFVGLILLIACVGCTGLMAAMRLERARVTLEGGRLVLGGWWGPGLVLALDELRVEPTTLPTSLTLVLGPRHVRLHRFLFKTDDWQTLVGLLSRALGYDVTEPATEAARLAKLAKAGL